MIFHTIMMMLLVEDGSGNWSVDTPFDAGSKSAQLSPYSYDFSVIILNTH